MFRVSDSLADRHAKIQRYIDEGEPALALVLAAADFERTIRRAIIALSSEPTKDVRKKIESRFNTIGKYSQGWKALVEPTGKAPLESALPEFDAVKKAFRGRNNVVHGKHGTVTRDYASERIAVIFGATAKITSFASEHGVDLMARMKVRKSAGSTNKA